MPAWSDHTWPAAETPRRFVVLVTLVNQQEHRSKLLGFGPSVREAAADAERKMRANTSDESWDAVVCEEA